MSAAPARMSRAHHERAEDAPEQHPVLVLARDREGAEDQREDEDVVDAQRLLDEVAGEERDARLGAPPHKNAMEHDRERHPDRRPDERLARRHDMRATCGTHPGPAPGTRRSGARKPISRRHIHAASMVVAFPSRRVRYMRPCLCARCLALPRDSTRASRRSASSEAPTATPRMARMTASDGIGSRCRMSVSSILAPTKMSTSGEAQLQVAEPVGRVGQQEVERPQAQDRERVAGEHDERVGRDREDGRDGVDREDEVGRLDRDERQQQRRRGAADRGRDEEALAVELGHHPHVPLARSGRAGCSRGAARGRRSGAPSGRP